MAPTVAWGEWPVIAILFIAATLFAGAARWLLNWQSSETERARKFQAEESEKNRLANAALQAEWREYIEGMNVRNIQVMGDVIAKIDGFGSQLIRHDARVDVLDQKIDTILGKPNGKRL